MRGFTPAFLQGAAVLQVPTMPGPVKAPKMGTFGKIGAGVLTLGILLDTSGSQQNVLPLEQSAGSAFLARVLRSKDEAFLISFDVNVDLLSDYTSNAHALAHAMDKAEINVGTGGMGGMPSGTRSLKMLSIFSSSRSSSSKSSSTKGWGVSPRARRHLGQSHKLSGIRAE